MKTIQNRHAEKWLAKITEVRAHTLRNAFSGELVRVDALRWCLANLYWVRLQVDADQKIGELYCDENEYYRFSIA